MKELSVYMEKEMEIELTEVWRILRKRLSLILSLVLVAVAVTGILSFFVMKPKYQSSTTVLVQSKKDTNQVAYDSIMANQQLVKTYEQIIMSNQIAEDVLNKLNLNTPVDQLLKNVQVKSDTGSLITTITATDLSPSEAVAIANGFAQSFSENIGSIMKVDNVTILDVAKLPQHPQPVSPRPYFNISIAVVVGLMVGVGLAFLFEYLDKTVKSEEEIQRLIGLPVLGVIAAFDQEKVTKEKKKQMVGGARIEIDGKPGQSNLPV